MKSVMLSVILVIASLSYAQSNTNIVLAITDLQVEIEGFESNTGEILTEMLSEKMIQCGSVTLVERRRIAALIKEGLPKDPDTRIRLGEMLDAAYITFGKMVKVFGDTIIQIRLIDIQKRKMISSHSINYNSTRKIKDILGDLAVKICTDIQPGSFSFDEPLRDGHYSPGPMPSSGSHSLPLGTKVWLVIGTAHGYFPQNAFIHLQANGNWICNGLYPGKDISMVYAVKVNEEGHQFFEKRVANNDWSMFKKLPPGSKILARVPVTVR